MKFKHVVRERIQPRNPVGKVVTYAVKAPVGSHRRPATCAEVDCQDHRLGWVIFLDVSIPKHAAAFKDLRIGKGLFAGRHWRELAEIPGPDGEGSIPIVHPRVALYFQAGQQCFTPHTVPLEREPILIVRGGDWRANTGLIRRHVRRDDWVEDFALNQDKLAAIAERG